MGLNKYAATGSAPSASDFASRLIRMTPEQLTEVYQSDTASLRITQFDVVMELLKTTRYLNTKVRNLSYLKCGEFAEAQPTFLLQSTATTGRLTPKTRATTVVGALLGMTAPQQKSFFSRPQSREAVTRADVATAFLRKIKRLRKRLKDLNAAPIPTPKPMVKRTTAKALGL